MADLPLTRKVQVMRVLDRGGYVRTGTEPGRGLVALHDRAGAEVLAWQTAINACLPLCHRSALPLPPGQAGQRWEPRR